MFLRKMGSLAMMFAAVGLIACSGDSSKTIAQASADEGPEGETVQPPVKHDDHDATNPSQTIYDSSEDEDPTYLEPEEPSGESTLPSSDDDEEGPTSTYLEPEDPSGEMTEPSSEGEDSIPPETPDDQGSEGSGMSIASGDYSCNVTRSGNSVTVDQRLEGIASYVSTVSGSTGRLSIETELWYADSRYAKSDCDDWKEEAEGWNGSMTVTCTSNTVKISEYDEGSLDGHEEAFKKLCEDMRSEYESGAMDQYM